MAPHQLPLNSAQPFVRTVLRSLAMFFSRICNLISAYRSCVSCFLALAKTDLLCGGTENREVGTAWHESRAII